MSKELVELVSLVTPETKAKFDWMLEHHRGTLDSLWDSYVNDVESAHKHLTTFVPLQERPWWALVQTHEDFKKVTKQYERGILTLTEFESKLKGLCAEIIYS